MAKKKTAASLLRLGSMGVVHELTRAADRHVASRGGAPWTPSVNRLRRQMAATVRRRSKRGGLVREAARGVASGARPSAVQRRAMRRDSYARQAESISDQQLMSIPASELPPELVERKRAVEKQQAPPTDSAPAAAAPQQNSRRAKIDEELRSIIGDPDALPPNVRKQLEEQIAEKFGPEAASPEGSTPADQQPSAQRQRPEPTERVDMDGPAAPGAPSPAPAEPPQPSPQQTPAQRKRENVQAVVDSQLEDAPQPRSQRGRDQEQSGGWLDKLQGTLDAVGVAEPTPFADGTNAVISLGRAAVDKERRGEHLQNAAISTVSAAVPYFGDAAKLLKVGRAAKKSQAARQASRGGSRGASQGSSTGAVPPGGLDDLRAGAPPVQSPPSAMESTPGAPPVQSAGGAAQPPRGRVRGAMSRMKETAADLFGGGNAEPPVQPPRFGAPTPDDGGDGGDSPRRRREDEQAIAAHDSFTDKLKTGAMALAGLAGKAYLAVEGLKFLNQGVLAINKDLRQYSGQLAGSYAEAENADISRDMRKARALDNPLAELQKEQTELKDTMAEIGVPIQYLVIKILTVLTQGVNLASDFVKAFFPRTAQAMELLRKMAELNDDPPGGKQFLQDLSDGRFDGFGIDDLGQRFEMLDKATRQQMGLTPRPRRPRKGKPPAP